MKTQENVKPVDIRPFAYAISLIDGKWKMHILFWLWKPVSYTHLSTRSSLNCDTVSEWVTTITVLPNSSAS